jgi:transcriptional regulator with XRE-family HTH domain
MIYDIRIPKDSSRWGEWLVRVIAQRDITVQNLADEIGVNKVTVYGWCRHPNNLKISRLQQIAAAVMDDDDGELRFLVKSIELITTKPTIKQHQNRSIEE